MPFISLDIEATGPVPGLYDMISLGAVKVVGDGTTYSLADDELYMEIQPFYGGVEPDAMRVHKLDLEKIKAEGVPFAEAAHRLREWSLKGASSKDPAVFVGYNATFDWSFVNDMFYRTGVPSPFGYKALDLRALVMGALKIPWLDVKQEAFLPLLEVAPLSPDLAHNALEDARHQGKILIRLLEVLGMPEAIHRAR